MNRLQKLLQTHYSEHNNIDANLYLAVEGMDNNDPAAAKDHIVKAFRYAEHTNTAFEELAHQVSALMFVLRDVDDDSDIAPEPNEPPNNESIYRLLWWLREKFEDIPF